MKFCFLCGKKTEKLAEGYCEDCSKKKFQLLSVPDEISITLCKCGKVKDKNRWSQRRIEDLIIEKLKVFGEIKSIRFNEDYTSLTATGTPRGSKAQKSETHVLKVKIIKQSCPVCSRQFGNYYESTVQIRGKLKDEDIDMVDDIVISRGGFYKLERVKGGYDLLISSKSLAKKITEQFRKKYKIQIKKSFRLVTKKEGKDIYRDTILLRID